MSLIGGPRCEVKVTASSLLSAFYQTLSEEHLCTCRLMRERERERERWRKREREMEEESLIEK